MNHDAASQSQVMVVHQEKTVLNYSSHLNLQKPTQTSMQSIKKQNSSFKGKDNRSSDLEPLLTDEQLEPIRNLIDAINENSGNL